VFPRIFLSPLPADGAIQLATPRLDAFLRRAPLTRNPSPPRAVVACFRDPSLSSARLIVLGRLNHRFNVPVVRTCRSEKLVP